MDVGCDYGRNGPDGNWISKLTIFATKAPDGMTLDQAFASYRNEITQTNPNATSLGAALNLNDKDKGTADALPEWRSEEFLTNHGGQETTDDLIVTVQNGWMLEIRSTYPGRPNNIVITKGSGPNAAADSFGDRIMGTFAYVQVSGTIGK